MPRILIVVEGHGEVESAPALVSRVLRDRGHYEWFPDGKGRRLGALPAFRRRLSENVEFLRR